MHDITPDAELIDFKESGEGMKPISEEEAKMLYAFRMVWKAEKEKTERTIHDQLVSSGWKLMTIGFVLINISPGMEKKVFDTMMKCDIAWR